MLGRWGRGFALAEPVAAVPLPVLSVITLFLCGIEDAITTTTEGAIRTAAGIGGKAILRSIIAFLPGIEARITAEGRNDATLSAGVGEGGVMERLFTLLPKEQLHDAIPADPQSEEAVPRAPIAVAGIPIITLFKGTLEQSIPAGAGRARR